MSLNSWNCSGIKFVDFSTKNQKSRFDAAVVEYGAFGQGESISYMADIGRVKYQTCK